MSEPKSLETVLREKLTELIGKVKEMEARAVIDEVRLNDVITSHTADTIYFFSLARDGDQIARAAKHNLELVEARAYREIRAGIIARGEKPTDKRIESEVSLDAKVILARKLFNDAETAAEMIKSSAFTFQGRRSLLDVLARQKITEMQRNLAFTGGAGGSASAYSAAMAAAQVREDAQREIDGDTFLPAQNK
ncbi:hypothetical protein [Chitinibacter tainanensis]|uniref:hypothetical protein n=1 Tax=Chitinibacter tainanensis TaxID=230667 RepID=UPI000418E1FD|nr:hypothetical protein [Chitinibacter tainanensis]